MTTSRDQVYALANKAADDMARYGPPAPYHKAFEGGSDNDDRLHRLLNQVEDDRAHAEAERLRERAGESLAKHLVVLMNEADLIDPYIRIEGNLYRDPEDTAMLYRKADGKPILI